MPQLASFHYFSLAVFHPVLLALQIRLVVTVLVIWRKYEVIYARMHNNLKELRWFENSEETLCTFDVFIKICHSYNSYNIFFPKLLLLENLFYCMLLKIFLVALTIIKANSLRCVSGASRITNEVSGTVKNSNITCKSDTKFCVKLATDATINGG